MTGTFLSRAETSQNPTSINSANTPDGTTQVDDQHPSSTTTNNDLFKHFVGSSDPAEQQKILGFFNKVLDLGVSFKSQPQVRQKKLPNPATKSFNSMPEEGISLGQLL